MRATLALVLAGLVAACAAPTAPPSTTGMALASPVASGSAGPAAAESGEPTTVASTPPSIGPGLPTTEPTGPSWTPRPAEALLVGSAVRVLVDRLNVRAKPTVNSKSLGIVTRDNVLVIDSAGPFANEGYSWHHAILVAKNGKLPGLSEDLDREDAVRGWIAVAKGSTDYVRKLRPRCPAAIDLAGIQNMLGSELLACFGSNTIELTGTFGCGGCGGYAPGLSEPNWLAGVFTGNWLSIYPVEGHQLLVALLLHFPPGSVEAPAVASVIRVRGHFDDPAARTCEFSMVDPLRPMSDNLVPVDDGPAELACSQKFVVESYEVLGTDPGFPFG